MNLKIHITAWHFQLSKALLSILHKKWDNQKEILNNVFMFLREIEEKENIFICGCGGKHSIMGTT